MPSHPSQIDGDGDRDIDGEGRAYTEPVVPTLADVDDDDIDMSECVPKYLRVSVGMPSALLQV